MALISPIFSESFIYLEFAFQIRGSETYIILYPLIPIYKKNPLIL